MPPEAETVEKPEPVNFFAKEKGTFDIPDAIDLTEDDNAPPAASETTSQPAAHSESDPAAEAEAEKTRARALGWKDPAEVGTSTTQNGRPWLDHKQYLERYDPKRLFDKVDTLERSFERRVDERVGQELSGLQGQIAATVKHQRDLLAGRYRTWIANAPNAQESIQRQADMDAALTDFDKKFQGRSPQTAPTAARAAPVAQTDSIPQTYKDAYADFEQSNTWFNKNRAMTAFAKDIVSEVASDPRFANNPTAEFAEIARRVREEFKDHELFRSTTASPPSPPAPPRKAPDVTGAPRRAAGGPTGWDALPAAAKQMFRKVHVPFGTFEDTEKDRDRYAKQILADTEKKRGFEI